MILIRLIRLTADPSDEPKGCYTRKVLRFQIFVHDNVSLKPLMLVSVETICIAEPPSDRRCS